MYKKSAYLIPLIIDNKYGNSCEKLLGEGSYGKVFKFKSVQDQTKK